MQMHVLMLHRATDAVAQTRTVQIVIGGVGLVHLRTTVGKQYSAVGAHGCCLYRAAVRQLNALSTAQNTGDYLRTVKLTV